LRVALNKNQFLFGDIELLPKPGKPALVFWPRRETINAINWLLVASSIIFPSTSRSLKKELRRLHSMTFSDCLIAVSHSLFTVQIVWRDFRTDAFMAT